MNKDTEEKNCICLKNLRAEDFVQLDWKVGGRDLILWGLESSFRSLDFYFKPVGEGMCFEDF